MIEKFYIQENKKKKNIKQLYYIIFYNFKLLKNIYIYFLKNKNYSKKKKLFNKNIKKS